MNGKVTALAGRLSEGIDDLKRAVDRVERLLQRARQTGDDGYLDGVALNLHSFYNGVERLFEDITRTLEEALPTGPNWHQDLLRQMAAELATIRPSVISRDTRDCLDEYRAFRHIVRHVYTFNLRASRIVELSDNLRMCYQMVIEDFARFISYLLEMASDQSTQ
jgi:hypothetical protein